MQDWRPAPLSLDGPPAAATALPAAMSERRRCAECGMQLVSPNEYHPYAACAMYRQEKDAHAVRMNIKAILEHGKATSEKNDGRIAELEQALRGLLEIEDVRLAAGAFKPNHAAQIRLDAARAVLERSACPLSNEERDVSERAFVRSMGDGEP